MNLRYLLSGLLIALVSACSLWADDFVDSSFFLEQKVSVNGLAGMPWEKDVSFDAERSRAWMDALHHAYETVLNLPLMEGKLVRHVLQTNEGLKERLNPVLLASPRFFYQSDTTGLVRCRVEVPMFGKNSLRSALYLAAMRPQPQEPLAFNQSWFSSAESAKNEEKKTESLPFRRLVIDVRSYVFEPSLFPRFFDTSGNLLFQESMFGRANRFSRPAVVFTRSISDARQNFSDDETYTIAARVDALARRDITMAGPDIEILARFARELVEKPLQEKDIIIVFDPENKPKNGQLGRVEAKEDLKAKK